MHRISPTKEYSHKNYLDIWESSVEGVKIPLPIWNRVKEPMVSAIERFHCICIEVILGKRSIYTRDSANNVKNCKNGQHRSHLPVSLFLSVARSSRKSGAIRFKRAKEDFSVCSQLVRVAQPRDDKCDAKFINNFDLGTRKPTSSLAHDFP